MADRERVIYDLERCTCHVPDACRDCSKYNADGVSTLTCMESLMSDVLELLKAQEPLEPVIKQEMDDVTSCIDNIAYCGNCGYKLGRLRVNYCENYGKAAKWEWE